MKRVLLVTAALAMTMSTTLAEAGPRNNHRGDRREAARVHRGPVLVAPRVHRGPVRVAPVGWRRGQVLAPVYRAPRYVIADYRRYRLAPPPFGHRYYRAGNDILLTAVSTGLIVSAFGGLFAAPPPPPPVFYGPPPPPPAHYGPPPPPPAPEPYYEDAPPPAPEPAYEEDYAPRQDRN